ncbi:MULTISPECIES: UDP-N-acetylglucosamine 1-carboxyvinyltransferase [unclassified Dietzia]|uniref:UDP-N-acetylglucosamine 1-carboxyvinyltransferase n=1 Tax=unclassified Dietzia TaxID=2617939 RepID=UPI000D21859B|nr:MULTISPECIES: UDP-N-acetylglucosamine 1-carboxyvinyltransferase [unclassified Dietzia]AVZ38738.1 UDP-N-acetylglucosamine 1-carboxyvinyltransferase [Dietzia sp. JS16-p6b]QGW23836.1 UDP-N-acetylglucosamine 1-carboxyvinyltransferase [Dietzia sp. DQ12-45-1b]
MSGNPTSREESFLVTGGTRLAGEVSVAGAKNSVLKLMAVALMAEGRTTLTNCPDISDVPAMADVLRHLGCTVEISGGTVVIDTPADLGHVSDDRAAQRLRASVCILGPLVGRYHRAELAMPGGDAIGDRPLNWHREALEKLGATTRMDHGRLFAEAAELTGARYTLAFPSVGATETFLFGAVLARGTSTLVNAAREPEIVDICDLLSKMGARISGAGTSTITIEGVESLSPVSHRVIGDRIVAATWAMGAVMTRGDVTVTGIDPMFIHVVLENLRGAGAQVSTGSDWVRVTQEGRPRARDVRTLPFPGFPTDLQPMAIALASVADGASVITENLFEARFRFVEEMVRMGVDAETDGHHAKIRGRERLDSATVWASDIRAGAGLVLAGMCGDAVTEVCEVFHIDRGYPDFLEKVRSLGGRIERVDTHR